MFSIITWDLNDWELDLVVNFLHILESNIPSTENGDCMKIRNFAFVDWCVMCNCCKEIVDHLLLHWEKAHRLWCFVFSILWESVGFTKNGTWSSFGCWNWLGKHLSDIWNLVLLWLMWCTVYMEGANRWMFEAVDSSDDQLLASFNGSLFDWSQLTGLETNF